MSIKIKEVAFFFHAVSDIPRAREFYGKLLGLKTGMEIEFGPGQWWVEYDIAGVALAISNAFPSGTPVNGAGLYLEVANLDETLAAIKSANIPLMMEVTEFPPCRMFGIKSPDGHDISFHQRKK
jgi:predicted enzyme related to lactoylglutathione lyase